MRFVLTVLLSFFSNLCPGLDITRENGFEIQVQPFPSTFLTQKIASIYGFERSRRQVFLNVVVLKIQDDGEARGAVSASVTGFSRNLIGQTQDLIFREINETAEAIYYLAPVRVSSEESVQFTLEIIPENERMIDVNFRHIVYVD